MTEWAFLFEAPAAAAPGGVPGAETVSPTFRRKLAQVARRLGTDPQHLLAVMSFETGGTFDPAERNRAGSGATGLIQFMPTTARQLGTTTDALAQMSPERQLDYVERYLRPYRGRLRSLDDTYMAVLYPQAIGKGRDYTLFRQGTRAYEQNAGLDTAQKGFVTVGDAVQAVGRQGPAVRQPARRTAAPREWGSELGLAGASPSAPGAGSAPTPQPVDWGQELFSTAASPTPLDRGPGPAAPPVSESPSTPMAGSAPTDWGQALFGTPARP